jgi:hypothetical protein
MEYKSFIVSILGYRSCAPSGQWKTHIPLGCLHFPFMCKIGLFYH